MDLVALADETAARLGVARAQVAVVDGGVIRTAETGAGVSPDTLFQIGSTTKLHTAVLVMQLADEGRIGLDTPVVDQLPGFRLADDESTRMVTPRHLMSMASGIDNGPYTDLGSGDDALRRYVDALASVPQVFKPGKGFGYSNASTCVSGRLVEHVTGMSWETALQERLCAPAGLARTTALGDDPEPSLPRSINAAGGTLRSTATDLVRFAQLFLGDGVAATGTRILSAAAVHEMVRPQVSPPPTLLADFWSLGPYGKHWDGGTLVGHSGTNLSGSSYLLWSEGIAVATTVATPALGYPFAQAVFAEVFAELAGIRPRPRPVPADGLRVPIEWLTGAYEMCECRYDVTRDGDDLMIRLSGQHIEKRPSSRLAPLSPTTFLPTDPVVDGNRGWAVSFLGAEEGPATHLVNGFYCVRRVA